MQILTATKRTVLFSLALSLLFAVGLLLYFYVNQTFRVRVTKSWVNHSLQVITGSEKILRLATQEAMSHRGYIITGDSAYLTPSRGARDQLQAESNKMRFLVRDNPSQANRLNKILKLASSRILLSDSINSIKASNQSLSNTLLENGVGRNLMNTIESAVNEFQLNEYRLLQARQSADQEADDKLSRILLFLLISLFVFVILFIVVLSVYVRSQDRLVQEGKYISELLKRISDGVLLLDGNFKVTDWNAGAERIYGIKAADAIGKPIKEIIRLTKSDFPDSGFQVLRETGQWNGEIHKFSMSGEEKFLLAAVSLITNTRQSAVGCVAVLKDITLQKRKVNQLTETNEGLEQLLQHQLLQTQDANRQLKEVNARLERSREEERKKISRELHDDLGQMLTGAKLHLSFIAEELNIQDPELREMLTNLADILDRSIQSVRNLSMELRPGLVEDLGFFKAVEFHAKRFTAQTHIPVEIVNEVVGLDIETSISIHLFRIFQEALNNISKHAQANKVTTFITLDDGALIMRISDNGKGFEVNKAGKSSLGLTSMQERAELINGSCDIQSAPGTGTVVEVSMPLIRND